MDWRHRAICRDEDPELFFPVGNSGPALLQIAEAKAVCQRCPVTSECLSWALETGQRWHTAFASAICSRAGPELPTGKKSSGSSSRQIAR